MSISFGAALLYAKQIGAMAIKAIPFFKPLAAQKAAAQAPEKFRSIDETLFDDVFRRLIEAEPSDSIFTRTYDATISKLVTPDFIRTPSVRAWLRMPDVKLDFQRLASSIALSATRPEDAVNRLQASFIEVGFASAQEAEPVVTSIGAMLAANVNGHVKDKGTAGLVVAGHKATAQSIQVLDAKLDQLISGNAESNETPIPVPIEIDSTTAAVWRDSFRTASRSLLTWPKNLTDGSHLTRPEVAQLLETIQASKHCAVALLGAPGSGKSALLASLGTELIETVGIDVLAIKSDLLNADVESEEDLRRELNLPDLPSNMLKQLASKGTAVLLIDQLDALAGHLDTKTSRLSVLLNLVKAVSRVKGLSIIVSCRTFEYTHDMRLSRIDAESITLELPPWEAVQPILESNGVRSIGWNSDAREVMRVPQQLNTYLQLRASGIDEPFSNYSAMLDRLWNARVLDAQNGGRVANLAYDIADRMANTESLWLAPSRFDDRFEEMRVLESVGILTKSTEGAIGFSHQTIYEHVLARSFAKQDGRLSSYVTARSQSLFVRPKIWAALTYLRAVEPVTYQAELAAIWESPELRNHVRYLLIEFMGSQIIPAPHEEMLLVEAAAKLNFRVMVLKAITGSQGWFARLHNSLIKEAMSAPTTRDPCVELLVAAWQHSSSEVLLLLRHVWLSDAVNDRLTLFVLQEAPEWTSELLEVVKEIATRTEIGGARAHNLVSVLGASQPMVAVDLLRILLEAEWSRAKSEALRLQVLATDKPPAEGDRDIEWYLLHRPSKPLSEFLDNASQWGSVPELAAAVPAHFLDRLWNWYLAAFQDMKDVGDSAEPNFGYALPYSVDFRFDGEDRRERLEPPPLLESLAIALERIADSEPEEVCRWGATQAHVALAPVQRLIAHALAHNPNKTSAEALQFLLADERRYFLGSVSDLSSTTLALVKACAMRWTSEEIEQYVARVREFAPARPPDLSSAKDIRTWNQVIRRTRIKLLSALPEAQRSLDVQRELAEAARAAPRRPSPDEDFIGGFIGSPMSAAQFSRASTDDIVNAFMEIPDATGWDHPRYFGRGGNIQLAREFAEFAKSHADQAIEVIGLLTPEFGQRPAGYALEALAESLAPERLMKIALDLDRRGFGMDEFKESVCRAVRQLLNRNVTINDEVVAMLERWVPASIDGSGRELASEFEEASMVEDEDRGQEAERFLLSGDGQISVLPNGDFSILSIIVYARLLRGEVGAVIRLLRQYLRHSRNKYLWKSLLRDLVSLPRRDSTEGAAFVGEVLSIPEIDGSREAAHFMADVHWSAMDQVIANLARWKDSGNLASRKGFGELVALLGLVNPDAEQARKWLDEIIENGAFADARAGAAATAACLLWSRLEFRSAATVLLLRLLARNEAAVWHQVFCVFRLVDKLEPELDTVRLMRGIAAGIHHAPAPREPYVVERLEGLLPYHADIVAQIASQLIQLWRDRLQDVGSSLVTAGQEMMDLAITLHRTQGVELVGLQMFEQLVEIDAYQAREVLDEIDHRIRPGVKAWRPRLRRRTGRRAHQGIAG